MAIETVTIENPNYRAVSLAVIDKLSEKVAKLNALLLNTYGSGGESFRSMDARMQDNYLWACSGIAEEIEAMTCTL